MSDALKAIPRHQLTLHDVMTDKLAKDIGNDIVRAHSEDSYCPQCGKSKRNHSVPDCGYTNCPIAGGGDK